MSSIVIQGDTSGSITVEAPSVAGTHTLTLPKATGNIATDATVGLGQKNLIINGDMRIAQRGTSVAGITSAGYYTVDRWQPFISTAGTWTMSQDTDVPTGQGFSSSVKFACTTANTSLSTNSQMRLTQHIEAYNVQHLSFGTANAKKVTFSFWIKSNKTGTYNVWAYRQDSSRQSSIQFTISLANTWEKKTLTFDGDTTGTINNDNGRGIEFNIVFVAGTDYSTGTSPDGAWETLTNPNRYVGNVNLADSTSNYINITGVQLEIGDTATPFENRMYGTELALCERYFQKIDGGFGVATASTNVQINVVMRVPMRTSPSATVTTLRITDMTTADHQATSATISLPNITPTMSRTNSGGFTGLTTSRTYTLLGSGTNAAPILFSAEL